MRALTPGRREEHTELEPPTVAPPPLAVRLAGALEWLFPSPCLGCGAALAGAPAPLLLCAPCASRLRSQPASACPGCGRPLPPAGAAALCGGCRERTPPWRSLTAAFLYLPPLTGVVRALKFRGGEFLGPALGRLLAARCDARDAAVVTAVPLSWPRLLARGYNQAEAVARPLAAALDLPYQRLLGRRPRRRQTGLARAARARNAAGAFRDHPRCGAIRGRTVLLVDDVMTTGATLAAAAAALRRAGAGGVLAAVVARTPRPDWGDPLGAPAAGRDEGPGILFEDPAGPRRTPPGTRR